MRYNVTSKDLAKKIKKDGTISKVNDIKATYKAGNIIVTNFGEFVAVGAEQIIHTSASGKQYKQWMVTLKNSSGTYKMTHNQAHKNKKMPKSAKLQQVIAGLLPAPKELIDQIVDIIKPMGQTLPYNLYIQRNGDSLQNKLDIISLTLQLECNDGNLCRKIYKQLRFHYHPDRNNGTTTAIYQHIQQIFEQWVNNK